MNNDRPPARPPARLPASKSGKWLMSRKQGIYFAWPKSVEQSIREIN